MFVFNSRTYHVSVSSNIKQITLLKPFNSSNLYPLSGDIFQVDGIDNTQFKLDEVNFKLHHLAEQ